MYIGFKHRVREMEAKYESEISVDLNTIYSIGCVCFSCYCEA